MWFNLIFNIPHFLHEINNRNWFYGFRKHEDLGLIMKSHSKRIVFALQSMYRWFHWHKPSVVWRQTLIYAKHAGTEPTLNCTSHCWSLSEVHLISGEYNTLVAAPTSEIESTPLMKWEEARKFKKLNNLLLQSQYILLLVLFVINSKNQFAANSEIHSINTRNKFNFHQPLFWHLIIKDLIFTCFNTGHESISC
jgi:hypothetical protein